MIQQYYYIMRISSFRNMHLAPTLDPLHPLHSAILELLAKSGFLTAQALGEAIRTEYALTISQASLYRQLAQLVLHQYLVKDNGTYGLNLVWLSRMECFALEAIRSHRISSDNDAIRNLKEGNQIEFFGESLQALDVTWSHVLVTIAQLTQERQWYAYNAHPYYPLGMLETELRLYQAFARQGITFHMLFGNQTFLDTLGKDLIKISSYKTRTTDQPPFLKEGYVVNALGDYIIEVIYPEQISRHFTLIFQTVQSAEDYDPQLFLDFFKMKARCKLTLRRSNKEAQKIRGLVQPYFE